MNIDICPRCAGSGSVTKVSNPEWPTGTEPHVYHVECPRCHGLGKIESETKLYSHFYCPRCERVTTKPWSECWCLGNGEFHYYGPTDFEADWKQMVHVNLMIVSTPRLGKEYDVTTGSTGVCSLPNNDRREGNTLRQDNA